MLIIYLFLLIFSYSVSIFFQNKENKKCSKSYYEKFFGEEEQKIIQDMLNEGVEVYVVSFGP